MHVVRGPSKNYWTLNNYVTSMCECRHQNKCLQTRIIKNIPNISVNFLNLNFYTFIVIVFLTSSVNSNTTNMNANLHGVKFEMNKDYTANLHSPVIKKRDSQSNKNVPHSDNYDNHDDDHDANNDNVDYTKVNFDNQQTYYNENFLHLEKFYNSENGAYSNYEDYKKFYLNPSNPLPKSNVKFKISSRIVQTKYGKLQGIILGMDEHRYLRPLEVFLGVPYATPPVGSNR